MFTDRAEHLTSALRIRSCGTSDCSALIAVLRLTLSIDPEPLFFNYHIAPQAGALHVFIPHLIRLGRLEVLSLES